MYLLGWIGNVFLVIAMWSVNQRSRWPFVLSAIGEVIWSVYSVYLGQFDMLFICLVFAALAVRNYFKWSE